MHGIGHNRGAHFLAGGNVRLGLGDLSEGAGLYVSQGGNHFARHAPGIHPAIRQFDNLRQALRAATIQRLLPGGLHGYQVQEIVQTRAGAPAQRGQKGRKPSGWSKGCRLHRGDVGATRQREHPRNRGWLHFKGRQPKIRQPEHQRELRFMGYRFGRHLPDLRVPELVVLAAAHRSRRRA